jgi:hypothetical protein
MENLFENYEKYRWFFTSKKNLVVGGKNSRQNDELLRILKKKGKDYWVIHTKNPGSPFSVILQEINKVGEGELGECGVFTACFGKDWKNNNESYVDVFKIKQLNKEIGMKEGTWKVKGKIERKKVRMELILVRQNKKLRAVPKQSVGKSKKLGIVKKGKMKKEEVVEKMHKKLKISKEEIASALPSGGINIEWLKD